MGTARLLLPQFKNNASNSARLFSSSVALIRRQWTHFTDDYEDSDGESTVYRRALKLQRPTTIKYQENLRNSVSLIGVIDRPLTKVNISNGKFGVYTILNVKPSAGAYWKLWVLLKFWEEMAELSVQHLKLNDLIYVSGPLGSYVKVNNDGKLMHNYEVNVKEINFIAEDGLGAFRKSVKLEPEVSVEDIKQMHRNRLHLWQVFFTNPYEWWDRRKNKFKPNAPDFKHKDTGEALWLKDNDPPWIKQQLQLHDSRLRYQSPGERMSSRAHLSPLVYD